MDVRPVKRTSISEQISGQLKEKLIAGELKPGDKLPSEHELCEMYQVSRTTVRQALANLVSLDLIETRFGEGSFVREVTNGLAMHPLISQTFLSEKSIVEVVEFRQLIEPNVTRMACEKATGEDVAKLRDIYRQMEREKDDLKQFAIWDCEFHNAVARISRNSYIIKIYEIIADILLHAFSDIVQKRGNEAGLKYHGMVLEAFLEKDAGKAWSAMKEHMDDLYRDYQ